MAALAVVAEMKAERTRLITMKLMKILPAVFPNLRINHSAKRLATPVATNILARTKEHDIQPLNRMSKLCIGGLFRQNTCKDEGNDQNK
jgi:hypothetical protein